MKKKTILGLAMLVSSVGLSIKYTGWAISNSPKSFIVLFDGETPTTSGLYELSQAKEVLTKNPAYNIKIIGHTNTKLTDKDAEILSKKRATVVSDKLEKKSSVDWVGKSNPLNKYNIESDEFFQKKLDRVEIRLSR